MTVDIDGFNTMTMDIDGFNTMTVNIISMEHLLRTVPVKLSFLP